MLLTNLAVNRDIIVTKQNKVLKIIVFIIF